MVTARAPCIFLTSILNEWGQFVKAVVVVSESEECYQRMARGLSSRFRHANAPAPKVLYTDNNCCRLVNVVISILVCIVVFNVMSECVCC